MTDTASQDTPPAGSVLDTNGWIEKDKVFSDLCSTIRPANKQVLFDALAAAGITSVVVCFDGYGDSGQIEDIEVHASDQTAELPTSAIEIAQAQWGSSDVRQTTLTLRDAIETLAYDLLAETHGGWENNEGAFGNFTFDVAARTITLDYNERIETSENSQHEF